MNVCGRELIQRVLDYIILNLGECFVKNTFSFGVINIDPVWLKVLILLMRKLHYSWKGKWPVYKEMCLIIFMSQIRKVPPPPNTDIMGDMFCFIDRYSSQCPVIQTSSNSQTHPEVSDLFLLSIVHPS